MLDEAREKVGVGALFCESKQKKRQFNFRVLKSKLPLGILGVIMINNGSILV